MKRFDIVKMTALSAVFATGALMATPSAHAQSMRMVNGQAYWRGDPGPVTPGPYWDGGEFRYDPAHYQSYWGADPQDYTDVVFAEHAGPTRCVWRKRVINSIWEFRHPYLRVCRP